MKTITFLLLLGATVALARGDDLKTNDGKVYEEYTVVSHDDKGIAIWYKDGQATIPFDNLPPDVQKQYDYKPKPLAWQTDYTASVKAAKEQNKLLLLDFTGSDWCPYCIALDGEVLGTPEFQAFAASHFICVKLDFPRMTALPADQQQQNGALKRQYDVHGFPSLLIVDASGKELGRHVGYSPGSGPDEVISKLKTFLPGAGPAN
ncbi:MAG TPA: thioredoxin family protein [Candidatus Methylacidiphilales bacterium]|jgi:thiol-disulfide isomerase/thioredoxin|nr:thioredoxin family protein [Candidatus Methylacidiphilales bacterium]